MKLHFNLNNYKIGQRLVFSYIVIFIFFVIIGFLALRAINIAKDSANQGSSIQFIISKIRDTSKLKESYVVGASKVKEESVFRQLQQAKRTRNQLQRSIKERVKLLNTAKIYLDSINHYSNVFFNNQIEYDSLLTECVSIEAMLKLIVEEPILKSSKRGYISNKIAFKYVKILNDIGKNNLKYQVAKSKYSETAQNSKIKELKRLTKRQNKTYFFKSKETIKEFATLLTIYDETNKQLAINGHENRAALKEWDKNAVKTVNVLRKLKNQLDKKYESSIRSITILIFSIIGGIFLLISGLAFVITKSITNGIKETVKLATYISKGQLSVNIKNSFLNRKDEIGVLSRTFQEMTQMLRKSIFDVKNGALFLSSSSVELSKSSNLLSTGATNQAASVEEISSTVEEMVANIEQNASNAKKTKSMANIAFDKIQEVADNTSLVVKKSEDISNNVTIVNDIANQTNILALNAAVEAARAGEAGRGFSVVANEVRKLAEKSKEAASKISVLSKEGVDLSRGGGENLHLVVPKIEQTSKFVEEISSASDEQSIGADQINKALNQLTGLTQENAAQAEEIAATASEFELQAQKLNKSVNMFNLDEVKITKDDKKQITKRNKKSKNKK